METARDEDLEQDKTPSQAEGDRETVEEDLGEKDDTNSAAEGKAIAPEGETSQAEGERA